ncbi:DUF922 domain-containing protein [Chryseobacterium sp. RG1]|uniref:DUF922 domain-containing protein n=1 Tax=Chryseobacterium tagetis TaxID=2801334 RepID=A0ABS7ZWS9_9FLAO|nr:DUF922 domain-containing protein [Chryseobacterium tagetis]MCA6066171.1 DUF922 domain-containing protein [Chryseobacterium tagetis]
MLKFIVVLCSLFSIQALSQKISWSENTKLKWENFQSPVNRKSNPDVVAYTHCGWEYSVVKSSNPKAAIEFNVETIFNEDKSWKDAKRTNDYVLLHEQKHFDIAEIFARKLRKEVQEKIKTSADFDKYFKGIYAAISNEYKNFQITYDKETGHGINKEKQAEYNTLISSELENLKNFKTS